MTEREELELLRLEEKERLANQPVPEKPAEGSLAGAMGVTPSAALDMLGRGLDFAGGLTRTGVMEGLERVGSLGQKGIGAENWKRAAKGQAKSFMEYLPEKGMTDKFYADKIAGFLADTATDPLSYAAAAAKGVGALKGLNPWADVAQAALKSDAASLVSAPFKIGKGLQGLGKRVYRAPYTKVAQDMASYADASRYAPYEAVDELYDAGVKGSTQDIKDAFETRRNAAYERYKGATEGYTGDLAPAVTRDGQVAAEAAVTDYIDTQVKKTAAAMGQAGLSPDDVAKKAEELRGQMVAQAADADDPFFTAIREGGEDDFKRRLKSRLRNSIGGEANERRRAVENLKEAIHPQFHPEVDKLVKKVDGTERETALKEIDALLNTGFSGEKNLADLDDIAAGYGLKASGSDAFGTNVFKASGKKETRKALASNTSSNIKGVIEENMDPADVATYLEGKREYGKWARSKKGFFDAISKSEGKPILGATDIIGGITSGGAIAGGETTYSPWALLGLGAHRGIKTLRNFPTASSRVGLAIKRAGNTSIWDNIARQGAAKFLADDEAK